MSRRLPAVNLAANYAHFGVMALVALFVVPVYARMLGPLAWGQLAICLTALGLLLFLELALAPILVRDVATAASTDAAWQTYRHYLRVYFRFAAACFLLGQALIAGLESGVAGWPPLPGDLAWAMRLMLVLFVFQLANAAAIGYWNGLQRQLRANLRLAGFALLKHAGALAGVVFLAPSAVAYMAPFALFGALEFGVNAWTVRRESARSGAPTRPAEPPRFANWRGMAGFGLAVALGLLTVQIDRLYLAQTLTIEAFGHYYLVSYLALAALNFYLPIQRVFLPRLASAPERKPELAAMLRLTTLLIVPPCLLAILFPEQVLLLWLHDAAIAEAGAGTLRLLFLAVAMLALSAGPKLLLVYGNRYRTLVAIEAAILVAQGLALWLCAREWGMLAGGLAWLVSASTQAGVAILLWRRAFARVPDRAG